MVALPPVLMDMLHLEAGQTLGVSVEGQKLILERNCMRAKFSLEELLLQCDPDAPVPVTDDEWSLGGPVGFELL